jgi:hypothetical protein
LVPATYQQTDVEPVKFFNDLLSLVKSLPLKISATSPVLSSLESALQQADVF